MTASLGRLIATRRNPDVAVTACTPWMRGLDVAAQEAVRRNVAQAPPLSDRQRERLRLLFRRTPTSGGSTGSEKDATP